MAKRIALFILGLMLAVGAFWTYQYMTGANFLPPKKTVDVTSGTEPAEDRPKTYESRRVTGELEYVLSAKNFEPAKLSDGTPIPGQFVMTEPAARYYTTDGRLITVHAQTGTVAIDRSVAGGKSRLVPRGGRLSGDVTITFGPQEADESSGAAKAGTIEVKLSKALEFDNVQRVMTSAGDIQVRSNQVAFDGEDLTIAFNPDQQRLEYFRIERGNKIIVREVDPESLSLADNGAAGKGGGTTQAATGAAMTGPAIADAGAAATQGATTTKANRIPTAYKLSFGQNVTAALGSRTLTSDRLYVLFMAAASEMEQGAKPAGKTPATGGAGGATGGTPGGAGGGVASGATTAAGSQPAGAVAAAPLPAAKPEDLVIMWTGPMEMRPTGADDLKLAGAKDKALEAVGTTERPVEIVDGTRKVVAGRLWLHAAEKRVEIEPGELGYVTLADPAKGTATCAGLSYVRDSNHLRLAGPGKLVVPQTVMRRTAAASAKPLTISWQRMLDLDLVDMPDPKKQDGSKPGKKDAVPAIRRALLAGGVRIDDPTFQLGSDVMDVLIATTNDTANPQAIEHLLATGNVSVKSFRNGDKLDKTEGTAAAATLPAGEPEGLTSQRLELVTAPSAAGAPVPSKLLVDGDVAAWSYREEKDKTVLAAATRPAKAPGKQTIYAPHLDITLSPKAKAPDGGAIGAGAMGMGDYEATRFVASGGEAGAATLPAAGTMMAGIKVELENYAPHLITATAQSLDATPTTNQATLIGGPDAPAKVTFAENTLTGGSIELDQNKKTFHIPGKGEFLFTLPVNKDRKQPTPMQVTWVRSMTFDSDALLATFDGEAVAKMIAAKASDNSTLTANRLEVKLKNQKAVGGSGASSGTDLAANLTGSSDLTLDTIHADGKVVASGGQMGADNQPLTRMFLTTERLVYNDSTHELRIPAPGRMLLEDDRPDKNDVNGKANGKGQTAFRWAGELVYNQRDNTVELTKEVQMVHLPKKPISVGGTKADAGSRVELNTEHLLAKLSQVKDAVGASSIASPVGIGNDGNQQLDNVRADHGAVLTMDATRELRADTLTFDNNSHIATASGPEGSPATFTEPDKQLVHSTLITWEMATNKVKLKDFGGDIHLE